MHGEREGGSGDEAICKFSLNAENILTQLTYKHNTNVPMWRDGDE